MAEQIKGFNVNGSLGVLNLTEGGTLYSHDNIEHTIMVDNRHNLYAYTGDTDPKGYNVDPLPSGSTTLVDSLAGTSTYKLYINSLYCGGSDADEHTLNYCSHNFVELSNLTGKDINLSGMSLQYAIEETGWKILPLQGIIKNGSTFLIRGAQCSVYDYSKIKVDNYDMEWRINDEGEYDPEGELIKFSTECVKFYLCFSLSAAPYKQMWQISGTTSKPQTLSNYIDLVGINGVSKNADGYEKNPYPYVSALNSKLFKKYYAMDPVKQATKDLSARSNKTGWNYVDLTKEDGDVVPSLTAFTPMASEENKTIFTDKTKLYDYKPSMITCSFGIQATDNGSGATRCFNWLSKNLYDEYIWIRLSGATSWGTPHESFKNETGIRQYYNRKTAEYADGSVVTAHKFIISGLTAGKYEYVAGHKNKDNTPNLTACTDAHYFTVRSNSDLTNGFSFIQTSDQQGFNWNEYQVWKFAAETFMKEDSDNELQFMINTGDIGQNGNRMNEWIDYFQAKPDSLNNLEENATIGNNDLSPKILYKLGDGEDQSKLSLENYEFFFTSEMDENNPSIFTVNSVDYYIPSLYSFNYGNVHFLCMNTEIKNYAEYNPSPAKEIYASPYPFTSAGILYPKIKEWCEKDYILNSNYHWNIMYCHEMPFTILTTGITTNPMQTSGISRTNGCNANTNMPTASSGTNNYWLSEFCQTHNYKLAIGGHKHTQATSWPMLENVKYENGIRTVDSYRPIIVLSSGETFSEEIAKFALTSSSTPTSLTTLSDGRKYPNTWVNNGAIISDASGYSYLCQFEREDNINNYGSGTTNAVVYAMSQATGYKHTSNKELPGIGNPWQRYYYPTTKGSTAALAGQKYPFYTIWTITDDNIEGKVRKIDGIFNASGTFDINIEGYYSRQGKKSNTETHTALESINGLYDGVTTGSTETIKINH